MEESKRGALALALVLAKACACRSYCGFGLETRRPTACAQAGVDVTLAHGVGAPLRCGETRVWRVDRPVRASTNTYTHASNGRWIDLLAEKISRGLLPLCICNSFFLSSRDKVDPFFVCARPTRQLRQPLNRSSSPPNLLPPVTLPAPDTRQSCPFARQPPTFPPSEWRVFEGSMNPSPLNSQANA